jgi:hypothetical protein
MEGMGDQGYPIELLGVITIGVESYKSWAVDFETFSGAGSLTFDGDIFRRTPSRRDDQ